MILKSLCRAVLYLTILPVAQACAIPQSNPAPTTETGQLHKLIVETGSYKCPIKLRDLYNAAITNDSYTLVIPNTKSGQPDRLLMYLTCTSSTSEAVRKETLASFNAEKNQWELDSAISPDKASVFPLRRIADAGVGVTIDDDTNSERRFEFYRNFSFCLRKPPIAVCGGGRVKQLSPSKSTDLLPYALKVVESIEFVEP